MDLFHYTDTARLPYILRSGELRPGRNAVSDFPEADLLWATSDERGDRTASSHRGEHWRSGRLWHVRVVVDSSDFDEWTTVRGSLPGWTRVHVRRLEAHKDAAPASWWCRQEALPRASWQAVEVRSYADNRWREAELSRPTLMDNGSLFVMVGDKPFCSMQSAGPSGTTSYDIL